MDLPTRIYETKIKKKKNLTNTAVIRQHTGKNKYCINNANAKKSQLSGPNKEVAFLSDFYATSTQHKNFLILLVSKWRSCVGPLMVISLLFREAAAATVRAGERKQLWGLSTAVLSSN